MLVDAVQRARNTQTMLESQIESKVFVGHLTVDVAPMVSSMLGHQGLVQGSWLGLLNAQTVCAVDMVVNRLMMNLV